MAQLERLLPPLRPTGDYAAAEFDQVRAFQLLAHAEIESFVEDRAIAVIDRALDKWRLDGRARKPVVALLAFTEEKLGRPPETIPPSKRELNDRVERAKSAFSRVVHSNNGIKERDLLSILLPVGVLEVDIDETWLASMSSFGEVRGTTAHKAIRVQTPPDPATERARIKEVMEGLATLDQVMGGLARK